MSTTDQRILRLRTVELLGPKASTDTNSMLKAKRNGIDCWVHELPWDNDTKRQQIITRARSVSRPDFRFSVCIVISNNAVATRARIENLISVLSDPNCLTVDARPTFYVRDEAQNTDLLGFVQPIRQAARTAGLREPRICRIVSHGELDGFTTAPGFDDIVEMADRCECHGPTRIQRSTEVRRNACLVAWDSASHMQAVSGTVQATIAQAVKDNAQQCSIHVHTCNEWTDELRRAHDLGVLQGMEHMPSFPRAAAPYESSIAYSETTDTRPALTVAMVAQGDPEATMVCLQSVLDTSSDIGDLEFVVVDNGTSDETRALLAALEDNVRSVRNEQSIATKDAWKQALSMTKGELVLMISNDVVVGHGWHGALLRALSTDSSCNAVTPAVAVGTNQMPTQPPATNSGVCILARGNAARAGQIGDARFIDESVVFLRIETPERAQ